MWITLGCLVAAMTATASFLSWIDPSQPIPLDDDYIAELEGAAHSVVTEGVELKPARWSTIDIQSTDSPLANTPGVLLAAGTDSGTWHFRVDQNGRAVRGAAWRSQRSFAARPTTVFIQVAGAGGRDEFTVAQRFGIRALVDALRHVLTNDQTKVTISLPPDPQPRSTPKT